MSPSTLKPGECRPIWKNWNWNHTAATSMKTSDHGQGEVCLKCEKYMHMLYMHPLGSITPFGTHWWQAFASWKGAAFSPKIDHLTIAIIFDRSFCLARTPLLNVRLAYISQTVSRHSAFFFSENGMQTPCKVARLAFGDCFKYTRGLLLHQGLAYKALRYITWPKQTSQHHCLQLSTTNDGVQNLQC